ncbi:hypothetical protein CLV59_1103 [Chitinophaga dinghuensis]|uniref:ATP-dependent Clp protease adaptor protein ClpS n=1 Tax=Chitinophaga dinghuensis TaxID=1539050 RepID=A0A327VNG5_9BACT|nr:hypothetical protein [Chitinophaga dinghuensis]RAJ74957.1 hypothetical protein CLV59_1103 [Chitinophaga dinghuensis]
MDKMYNVHISGYREGKLPFVSLVKLLLKYKNMSLEDARATVDKVWARKPIAVEFTDLNTATEFSKSADEAGLNCIVNEQP